MRHFRYKQLCPALTFSWPRCTSLYPLKEGVGRGAPGELDRRLSNLCLLLNHIFSVAFLFVLKYSIVEVCYPFQSTTYADIPKTDKLWAVFFFLHKSFLSKNHVLFPLLLQIL